MLRIGQYYSSSYWVAMNLDLVSFRFVAETLVLHGNLIVPPDSEPDESGEPQAITLGSTRAALLANNVILQHSGSPVVIGASTAQVFSQDDFEPDGTPITGAFEDDSERFNSIREVLEDSWIM